MTKSIVRAFLTPGLNGPPAVEMEAAKAKVPKSSARADHSLKLHYIAGRMFSIRAFLRRVHGFPLLEQREKWGTLSGGSAD
jgi:hypothetical protein